MKHLYVAITRPKKNLYIYDDDEEARKPIEMIWKEIDAIEKVTMDDIDSDNIKPAFKSTHGILYLNWLVSNRLFVEFNSLSCFLWHSLLPLQSDACLFALSHSQHGFERHA